MSANLLNTGVVNASIIENNDPKFYLYKNDLTVTKNLVNISTVSKDSNITLDVPNNGYIVTGTGTNLYRIQNLGLNGDGTKYYTTSYWIRGNQAVTINMDLCDSGGSKTINVTTSWLRVFFNGKPTNYYSLATGYNGFLDVANLASGIILYIRDLKIEEGQNSNPIFSPYNITGTATSPILCYGLIEY